MAKVFVCFIGTDGSGKSTLANRIYLELRKENSRVRLVYGRHIPYISKYLILLVRYLFLSDESAQGYDKYNVKKKALLKRSLSLAKAYEAFLMVEYYLQLVRRVLIPYSLGYSVVADRYVYDTIINDIAIDRSISIADIRRLIKRFWFFVPKPTIAFLIQIPEEIALQRKDDIPSRGYLRIRNSLYKEISEEENLIIMDGTLPIDKLKQIALEIIKSKRND